MRAAKVIVPVPPLAESLSEGTVKQLSKRMSPRKLKNLLLEVGDFVEQDEEITSIETDKVLLILDLLLSV
jgi:2-oxoglutarate dehydrogenase E2 component (dihydrolipoamide succinyltransferase)